MITGKTIIREDGIAYAHEGEVEAPMEILDVEHTLQDC